MAKITIIAFLAILLQVGKVFPRNPGSCPDREIPTGHTCLGFANHQCPLGQRCRYIPSSSLGICCRTFNTWDVCPSGSVPTGSQCRRIVEECESGSFCQYIPDTSYGYCCVFTH
ncbi:hypothetical protein CHS0354_001040 [Potamilus streckersoni]|uniref:Uncharacterized protein n=1 Tax=Potamilus streckersoni TaxID=2493646 RepID=A0AAE0W2X3_9BIVA|nr:hypothetical protein CHS0354_001040 [Potamilus streckersoni]